jgi:hypothetical protein
MTEEEKKATEAEAQKIAAEQAEAKRKEEEAKANAPGEAEAKIIALEKEKNEILEREANYKMAYLKEKKKNESAGNDEDETEEERVRRIVREEQARDRVAVIDAEKEALLKKTLAENKELKLAIQNKPSASSTGSGGSTEQPLVVSTIITPEQLTAFKARGWTDKDIERYKKNLMKNSR